MPKATRTAWRKSSYSGGGENCVEVAHIPGHVGIRDSKNPQSALLILANTRWAALTNEIKNGRYNLPHPT